MERSIERLHCALTALTLALGIGYAGDTGAQNRPAPAAPDRTILPIAEPRRTPVIELDVRNAKAPPRFEVKAPKGAPNVVIVLLDDMGFAHPSTFGGAIAMPTLDRLAANGLRYNNMHVAALCSPSRAALITGRNHHTNNTGAVQEIATAFEGNTGIRPASVAPLPEMLRLNGYNTAAFGKWHLTPAWETSISGPYTTWPTQSGFEKFYGFLGGETNQWSPLLYDGVARVELPADPNYHFMTDMTNQAIAWTRFQQSMTPGRPFFMYFAPGATHAPHHVPKEWADKYKGKFDAGWDKYREDALARQIKLGIVPAGTKLAPKPAGIKDWDKLTADERRLFARQMEVFAGFAEQADHEIGRLVKAIEDLGAMDNTLFIYVAGDNGASAEGGATGLFNELTFFNGVPEAVEDQLKNLDKWGGPETYPHYAAGWAIAGDAPFAWSKQVAGDYGGTKTGMVVHWPKGIKAKGEIRSQWQYITDLAPTVLDAAHLPFPRSVNGTVQKPFEGVSMAYTLNDAKAKDRRTTQYFEILGNRGIYHDGWMARTVHRAPWEPKARATLDKDSWELFDARNDYSLATDLAAQQPEKLKQMQAVFMKEAAKYNVLPIDDRSVERFNAAIAGRPDLMGPRTSITLYPGMTGMMENTFINLKNRSSTLTAELDVPQGGAEGVVFAQGGRFGGFSLYLKDGRPTYTYNWVGLERYTVASPEALPPGKATIKLDFAYDGGGSGKGGIASLSVGGRKVAEGRIEKTIPFLISPDEGADVGEDDDTPVSGDYVAGTKSRFTGKIEKVTVEVR
ncbi:arylsulfatase [Variovorax saccharolyticus]|uniref:arylsulfatase n=1 Tax=Variovorax saccharolyticus TaxID=3053516 RepID=UPI002577B5A0|nr:arylsulfatase [Variovorax sp. J22R187]MDM0022707.1 arylsulfatase [Variovorax sp. J22R187]